MKIQKVICFILVITIFSCHQTKNQVGCLDLIPYKDKKGKWGYIDNSSEKIIIPCQYKRVYPFIYNRAKVEDFNRYSALIDTLGNFIVDFKYRNITPFSKDGFAIVEKEKYQGIIDTLGNEVVSCKYDGIEPFINSLAKVTLNGKRGLIDTLGNEIIACKYDEIEPFTNYLARITIDSKYGCIDKEGNEIIPCTYEYLEVCNYNIINVSNNDKYGYFNKSGKAITPFKYDFPSNFFDGHAAVSSNRKKGYIDTTGKEKIPLKYDDIKDFSDGMGGVMIGDKRGYYNTDGKMVYLDKFTGGYWIRIPYIPIYSSGLLAFINDPKKGWGFIDKNGKIAIPFMYDGANNFKGNVAVVEEYSNINQKGVVEVVKYGAINKKNEFVIPFTDYYIDIDSDSLFIFSTLGSENKKYGLYNSYGKELLPCKYDKIERISDKLFKVVFSNYIGVVNTNGEILHNFIFEEIGRQYYEDLIAVRDKNGVGFLDKAGKIVIPCKYERSTGEFTSEGICLVYSETLKKSFFIDKKGNEFDIEY